MGKLTRNNQTPVRPVGAGDRGGVRVGLRFDGLSAPERDMLDSLLGRDKAARSAL